jgi:hypothetical protein
MKKKFTRILGVGLTVALMVSLMLGAAPVKADVSQPSVTVTPDSISAAAQYSISFYNNLPLAVGQTVTVQFPSDTGIAAAYTGETDVFLDGLINTGVTAGTVTVSTATREVTITVATAAIASADKITVKFVTGGNEVKNPTTPGSYTLKVKTSLETTYVESKAYTIGVPGVVAVYNKGGNYTGSYNTVKAALAAANAYDVLKIGPGTYTDALTGADGIDTANVTLEASGTVAECIIKADLDITAAYAKIDGLTIKGAVDISAAGDDVTIINCDLTKKSSTSGATLLTSAGDRLSVKDCTINTTSGSVQDTGIKINAGATIDIDGCTFTTDEGTTAAQDIAIEVPATSAVTSLTVKSCTLTGTKGIGYKDANTSQTTASVRDSTFDGFEKAFSVLNAVALSNLTIRGNTINNSSKSTVGAIDVDATTATIIVGNDIEDNKGYSVHIAANQDKVTVVGNNFGGNGKGFKNATTTKMSAVNNWWGDVSGPSGEGTGTGDAVSTYVTYKPFLLAPVAAGTTAAGATGLDAKTICGVQVSGLTSSTLIWLAQYTANPKDVEPTYDALADAWFDVYITDGVGTATVKLYADDITKDTDAYFWSTLKNKWEACSSQGASASGGYVWVTITTATSPNLDDLCGLPFVLVGAPAAAPPTVIQTAPKAGATDIPISNIPFTWTSVEGATSYELELSAKADMSVTIDTATAVGTAYTYTGTLDYGFPYYWQVTALREGAVKAKSDVATFITMAEPVEPTPPVVIEPAPPPVINLPAPVVNIPPAPAPTQITPGWIWAIVAIGAILVIAVIVLIVRTRRVV